MSDPKEELAGKLMAAGKYLVEQTDNELVGRFGRILTEWANEQEDGWKVEVIVASLVDTLAYMIAEYGLNTETDKRMLLGATSAGLAMLGSDFITAKMEETPTRMN